MVLQEILSGRLLAPRSDRIPDVMNNPERILQILLRIGGVTMLTAFFAIFLPVRWMAVSHEWLGLGPFPASPIVDYLTRSASLLYAWHGGLLLVASTNVRRHSPVLLYLGFATAIGGLILLGIDLHAGMPTYWTVWEGPPVTLLGCVMVWLVLSIGDGQEPNG